MAINDPKDGGPESPEGADGQANRVDGPVDSLSAARALGNGARPGPYDWGRGEAGEVLQSRRCFNGKKGSGGSVPLRGRRRRTSRKVKSAHFDRWDEYFPLLGGDRFSRAAGRLAEW